MSLFPLPRRRGSRRLPLRRQKDSSGLQHMDFRPWLKRANKPWCLKDGDLYGPSRVGIGNPYIGLCQCGVLWILPGFIGKYLSGLCKLDHVFVLKAGFETQLRAPRLSIPFGMSALGMTRQIGDGRLQGGIEPRHVPTLQGLDNVA